jgi:hypothetical protein
MFITFSPIFLTHVPALYWYFGGFQHTPDWLNIFLGLFNLFNLFILALLSIVSRIALLIIAFRSLSTIPATGHQSIEWADFTPHI